jgi:cell division septal protein FtsQ
MGNRQNLIPTHIREKMKRRIRRRIITIVIFTLMILVGIVLVMRLPFLRIQKTEVFGNQLIDREVLETHVKDVFG